MSNEPEKTCTWCGNKKIIAKDFYMCQGRYRSECKACTIRRNVRYQRKIKAWKNRFIDPEQKRSYMVEYYHNHKEQFAEYRRKFKEKYPDYYREYSRKRKEK